MMKGVGGALGMATVPLAAYQLYSMLGGSDAAEERAASEQALMDSVPFAMSQRPSTIGEEADLDALLEMERMPRSSRGQARGRLPSRDLRGILDDEMIMRVKQLRMQEEQGIAELLAKNGIY